MKLPELKIGNLTARLPLLQGGMSVRVSTSSLATAVADCGGVGTIGGSGIPIEELQEDIRKAKRMTRGIVAVNIMFAVKQFMETVKASIDAGVDMIVTGAGFSRDIFKVGRDHDVPIVSIVSIVVVVGLANDAVAPQGRHLFEPVHPGSNRDPIVGQRRVYRSQMV